jgi:hypothetical protein
VNWDECCARNMKHLRDPEPGDYWHEMFSPQCVVIERIGPKLVLCRKTKDVDLDHWTWDLDEIEMVDHAEWSNRMCYGSMPDKTIGTCEPGRCLRVVDEYRAMRAASSASADNSTAGRT